MYRCTECHAEYEEFPEYCDCGNDQFEEITDETEEYEEEEIQKPVSKKNKRKEPELTEEELEELEEEKKDKIKSLIAAAVILILCIVVFVVPPHKKKKIEKAKNEAQTQSAKLPSVSTYWDDSLPRAFKKEDPLANLPLLNENFAGISSELREYLVSIGREFNKKWDTSSVEGTGTCKVQFIINKEGGLDTKTIIASSNNSNLNDSVSLLLTNITGFDMPPDDYRGEKIYIIFSIDSNGQSKVSYPSK